MLNDVTHFRPLASLTAPHRSHSSHPNSTALAETVSPEAAEEPLIELICLDMDGVCCDFVSEILALFTDSPDDILNNWPAGEYRVWHVLGITESEMWQRIAGNWLFWQSLPATAEFFGLLNLCHQYAREVVFASSPSPCPSSQFGKALWLQDHGHDPRQAMLGCHKHLLAAPARVLIDDSTDNCTRFEHHEGHAILFPRPWNTAAGMTTDPLLHIQDSLEFLTLQITAANTLTDNILSSLQR